MVATVASTQSIQGVASGNNLVLFNEQTPAAPSNFAVNFLSSSSLALGWDDNSNNEDSFELQERVFSVSDSTTYNGTLLTVDEYYQPTSIPSSLTFISWDFPNVVANGIDIDYKMTGYDWFNRALAWSVESGPSGMTIDTDGTLHWTPSSEGTQEVTVGLSFGGVDKITKTFTITVSNSRCVFIAPDGNDTTGDGSVGNPYLTFDKAAGDVSGQSTAHTIYHRGGTYTRSSWAWYSVPALATLADKTWAQTEQLTVRNYPGETVNYSVSGNGFRFNAGGNVLLNINISGATTAETAGIISVDSVAKKCTVSNSNWRQSGNCTGFKTGGGAILDSCTAYDNYDRADPTFHNSSNYLNYGTSGASDTFYIDCISDSLGDRFTSVGFKVKHAGNRPIHYHRCVSMGGVRPFACVQNRGSIRHCMAWSDSGSGAVVLGITDPSTGGNTDTDEAMLVQANIIASTTEKTISISDWALQASAVEPIRILNNFIEAGGTQGGSVLVHGNNATVSGNIVFSENAVYSADPSDCFRLSQSNQSLSTLFTYGSNNSQITTLSTYTKSVNGRSFQIANGVGSEIPFAGDSNGGQGSYSWQPLESLSENVTSYNHLGLAPDTAYFYRLRSSNSAGVSAWVEADGLTTADIPTAPSGFRVEYASDTSLELLWTRTSNLNTGYEIERSPNGTSGWAQVLTPAADDTSATNTALTVDTTYYYRIRSVNGSGESAWVEANGTTTAPSELFTVLFEDDLVSGDFSKHNAYWRWGKDGNIPAPGAFADKIVSVPGPQGPNVNAIEFTYGTWQEAGFCLTESISQTMTAIDDPDNDSHYPEVWLQYDMFVPANYTHASNLNSIVNNKGFASMWQGTYSPEVKLQGVTEWWPKPDGYSEISVNIDGHKRGFDYVAPSHQSTYYKPNACLAFIPADLGNWITFTFHWVAPSGHQTMDGEWEFYRNGTLIGRMTGINFDKRNPQTSGPIGFNRGYFLGYHNSGYAAETTFYITNVKFGGTLA